MYEDYNKGLEFHNESEYRLDSVDNAYVYKNVICGEPDKSLVSTMIGIRCTITGLNTLLVAGGGTTGVHNHCYYADQHSLYVCAGDKVFCIDNGTFELKWQVKVDDSSCFRIFPVQDFFIIHGEC